MKKNNPNYEANSNYDDGSMNTKDFLIGALIGGMVGAATALFLAPKSGKELRENINLQAGSLKERASDWTDMARVKGYDLATEVKDKTASLTKVVQEQSNAVMGKVKTLAPANTQLEDEAVKAAEPQEALQEAAVTLTEKLEETKKAFDDTEKTVQQAASVDHTNKADQ
ncbi:YtxH domain-containing protein [Bacillus sp. REN10]|uniref:YtxH domain-containing protein n=1 Tax=Bacillus sp. REN10 TaxID=2782541 RepID=UPI00193BEB5A|nr:YtxH domain-containing protein [Bacillus sp. REN10]